MTRNITLKVDEKLLLRAKHIAVDENTSLSSWVARVVEEAVRARDDYHQARKGALRAIAEGFPLGGEPLTREEMHER